MLQAAAVVLVVVTHFDGCVTEELTRWGYKVVEKTTPTAVEEPTAEAPVEGMPA